MKPLSLDLATPIRLVTIALVVTVVLIVSVVANNAFAGSGLPSRFAAYTVQCVGDVVIVRTPTTSFQLFRTGATMEPMTCIEYDMKELIRIARERAEAKG